MRRITTGTVLCLAAGLLLAPAAFAANVALPIGSISGGGSSTWGHISNSGYGSHFMIYNGALPGQGDAFDDGATISVDGASYLNPDGDVDLTGSTVTTDPASLSGLSVNMQYYFDQTDAVVRTLVNFYNPEVAPISATASFQTNLGSDSGTQVISTSSGDTAFTTADRWIITDDSTTGGDPTVTHVLYGPGGPLVTSNLVSLTVFSAFGTQGVRADYGLTVAAGDTLSLMFFNGLAPTATAATGYVSIFDTYAALGASSLLSGLSQAERDRIVNWALGGQPDIPEPTTLVMLALAGAGLALRKRVVG